MRAATPVVHDAMRLVFGPEDREGYTLRKIADLRLMLAFECRNCHKLSQPDFLDLVARYGPNATIGELRPRAKCSRCGKRTADVLLKSPGTPRERGWEPRPPSGVARR